MNNKILFIACLVVAIAGGFFAGTRYSSGKNVASLSGGMRNFQDFQNMSQEERQRMAKEMGNGNLEKRGFTDGQQSGANFINGEIISKDNESITVETRGSRQAENQTEGSKIIFFSDTTEISKFIAGNGDDLRTGANVMISGRTNSDGSITAETIQLRSETDPVKQ